MTNAHVYCTFEQEQMIVPTCTVVYLFLHLKRKGISAATVGIDSYTYQVFSHQEECIVLVHSSYLNGPDHVLLHLIYKTEDVL